MRSVLLSCVLLLLFTPFSVEAKSTRLYEKWLLNNEEEVLKWNTAGVPDEVVITPDGVAFNVEEQAAFFRPLPEGFHKNVDAIRLHYDATGLEEVVLLFIRIRADGEIVRRFRLVFPIEEGMIDEYVSVPFYKWDVKGTNVLAVHFRGDAQNVVFGGVRFLHFTMFEKLVMSWKSFWTFDSFSPFSINIFLGPVIMPDTEAIARHADWWYYGTSVNAYFMVGLALFGMGLLFWAARKSQKEGLQWLVVRKTILKRYFLIILLVWMFYDLRMGAEYIRNVAKDYREYIAADPSERTFRDHDRFYDFVAFVQDLVADRSQYEVFLSSEWPYFGSLRYYTYPSLPNPGEPVSDTWVVYDRSDITVGEDGMLYLDTEPFTKPGALLGRFDEHSFVFREHSGS